MINIVNTKPKLQTPSILFFIFIILTLLQPTFPQNCNPSCQTCIPQSNPTPYSCLSCPKSPTPNQPPQTRQYLWSCQSIPQNNPLFIILCVVIVLLDLFMLGMGFGVYQLGYQYVQLCGILLWAGTGSEGVAALQGACFGIFVQNSFTRSYGVQFIFLLFIITVFFFLYFATTQLTHNPTAILIRRKRITFPTRLVLLFYPMLLFSSLSSIVTIKDISKIDIFQMFLSIVGLLASTAIFIGIFLLCNFKRFKLEDPCYYVIGEKMVSTRWWVRNKLVMEVGNITGILLAFTIGYTKPEISALIMFLFQAFFTCYLFIMITYTKPRYKISTMILSLNFLAILGILYALTAYNQNPQLFPIFQKIHFALVITLCTILILTLIIQILAQRYKLMRQLRSFKNRFLTCQKINQNISLNKYDSGHGERMRVTEFQNNLVYMKDLGGIREKFQVEGNVVDSNR